MVLFGQKFSWSVLKSYCAIRTSVIHLVIGTFLELAAKLGVFMCAYVHVGVVWLDLSDVRE